MYGHIMFNGPARQMQLWLKANDAAQPELRHTLVAHDVGVADGTLPDQYGVKCKCPPGTFTVGTPQACAKRNADGSVTRQHDDDQEYGCFFTPLSDETAAGPMEQHGRSGIGVHGGGSDLPNPFALQQGWEFTFGCIRLQNADNEQTFVPFVNYVHEQGGRVELTVTWT